MQTAYITDKSERARALEVLAKMKDLEAKRKKKMKTVRLDSRTVVSATKAALAEKMEIFRKEEKKVAKVKGKTARSIEASHRRRELIELAFGDCPTMDYQAISKKLREERGMTVKEFQILLKKYVKELKDFYEANKHLRFSKEKGLKAVVPEWAVKLFKERYNMSLI